MKGPLAAFDQRVLLRAATSRDGLMTRDVLAQAGIESVVCADLGQLVDELNQGAATIMVAEEAVADPRFDGLEQALNTQPPWSDIPVILLARQGADSTALNRMMARFTNATVIERPMRVASLVSAVQSALRARQRQYQTRTYLADLQEADQRKTEFLATLAHELRNPLAPLSAALSLLTHKNFPPEKAERQYAVMKRQIDHMVRLINDLMEVSRITRNKIDMELRPLALKQVITDAIELSRPRINAAHHTLHVMLSDDASLNVSGDSVRLAQVFSNLLNNAAKYTPTGGTITIRDWREGDFALVQVVDSGIGLAPEMLGPIFDMFVQVGDAARFAQGGLGIGLTLVKSLVEAHGGQVTAESAGPGTGSAFTVRLPILPATSAPVPTDPGAASAATTADGQPLTDRRILVADDNHDAADFLAEWLRTLGAQVSVAYGGEEAIELSKRHAFDVAVLDVGMPRVDGCEVARVLRSAPGSRGPLLIALTGWGQAKDRDRVAAAGFDHHLLKPVDASALTALLQRQSAPTPITASGG